MRRSDQREEARSERVGVQTGRQAWGSRPQGYFWEAEAWGDWGHLGWPLLYAQCPAPVATLTPLGADSQRLRVPGSVPVCEFWAQASSPAFPRGTVSVRSLSLGNPSTPPRAGSPSMTGLVTSRPNHTQGPSLRAHGDPAGIPPTCQCPEAPLCHTQSPQSLWPVRWGTRPGGTPGDAARSCPKPEPGAASHTCAVQAAAVPAAQGPSSLSGHVRPAWSQGSQCYLLISGGPRCCLQSGQSRVVSEPALGGPLGRDLWWGRGRGAGGGTLLAHGQPGLNAWHHLWSWSISRNDP